MLIFYFFIVALTYSQTETYLLRLNDSEIQRYKGNTTLIRIGKSPFYAIQSSESPNFGSVISKNNSYRLSNWYSDKIQAAAAHAVTRGHSSTIVAIIDSGTDLDLTQFQSSYWINPAEDINSNQKLDSLDLNGIDDDGNGIIDDVIGYDFVDNGFENQFFDFNEIDPFPADDFPQSGHGTPIVDIIRQLAPEVKLMILKAADANGLLQELAIARSIIYAQENGAKVINMSFGNTIESAFLRSVIDYVTDFGVICVASSGNEGSSQVHFPAAFQSVIAVGNSNRFDERSASSNYGDALDLVAPGTEIPVTGRFGQFYTVSGTSFSAPMVSAAAALVLDVIDLDPAAMKHHLKLSSDDISLSGYDRFTGAGRLNLNKSVHQISHNQIRVISPADHSFYSDQFVPLRIDANGTHIETVELSVYSNTKIVYKNDWKDRQFYGDSLFNVNMLNLSEGEYTIELAVSGFQSNTLITRTKFTVDRSPVSISGKSSGPILNKEQLNFYIEYTVSEDVSISFRTLPNLYEFSQFNNSNRFNNRVFLEVPFTDLAGQNQLVVTLSDRANNQLKDTLAIPTQLGYYQKPFEYRLTNLKKARSVVSEIHTDLDHDNRPEFWLSRYQIGLKIDSTFVIEQQPDLSFKTVAAYQIQSVLRDQIDTNNDGLFQLLFGYADQANIVNQDGGFQLSSSASLSGAGIGTTFIQSSEPLVALRTATRYNLYNIHLLKIPTELTNFSTDPNFLDIPKLVQSQNSLFFADKNGNILWYNRNTFDPDTVLNSTYPEGSHSLFRIDRDLFYTGALVPNLGYDDNAYQQSRRFLQKFNLDQRRKTDSLMIRDFNGNLADTYLQRIKINLIDYLLANVSGQLYLLTTDLEPLQYLGEADGYSSASSENLHIFSRKDSVYALEFNPETRLTVNHINLKQESDSTVLINWTASDLFTKAYIYSEKNQLLNLIDSTVTNSYSKQLDLNDTLRFAVRIKSGSQSSPLLYSDTFSLAGNPELMDFQLLENRYLRLHFDRDLDDSRTNLANFKLMNGSVESLFSNQANEITLTIRLKQSNDLLTLSNLTDRFGRKLAFQQVAINQTIETEKLKVTAIDFISGKEFKIQLNQFIVNNFSIRNLESKQLLTADFEAGEVTIRNKFPFRHGKHYSFELIADEKTQYFGFTYNSEIADIILFPNPFITSRHEYLTLTNIPESSQLLIFNLSGHRIFLKEFFSSVDLYNLNFKAEIGYQPASGIYFWVLKSKERNIRGKFTVIN